MDKIEDILEQLREINFLLQKEGGFVDTRIADLEKNELPFQEMIKRLAGILGSNTYLIDVEGCLLGYDEVININNDRVKRMLKDQRFPVDYANNIANIKHTVANIGIESNFTAFPVETRDIFHSGLTTIVPIFASGKRLGSLIFARLESLFEAGDLILAEHSATVIGMELLRLINIQPERATSAETSIQIALQSLSYSETEAVVQIFSEINELETIINASKISESKGITRSIIVNALRKLESARILESRSLGMKGTYIKVLSPIIFNELKKHLAKA